MSEFFKALGVLLISLLAGAVVIGLILFVLPTEITYTAPGRISLGFIWGVLCASVIAHAYRPEGK